MEQSTITKKTMRAALYIRCSTNEQIEGYGLQVQEEKLRAFVALNDYTLDEKHVYKDEGFSGSLPVLERPGLKKLLEDAGKREFDNVVVYRLDRLFRKARLLLQALEDFDKNKIGFKSVTESIDTTSSTGRFVFTCLGAIAEMERETIRERTMSGRISAAKDGKWMTGVPPYGYNLIKETKQLEINQEEAKWVRSFFKWIVADRLSLREVQQKANDMKIPLPRRKVSNKKTLNYWHKRTIGRMLTNETYTGTAYFGKYKRPFNNLTSLIDQSLLKEKRGWISIKVPPIISEDLFEKCKQQLIKNREFSKRNQKRNYLFSKILYCGTCGFKLFGGYQPPRKDGRMGSKYYHGVCSKHEVGTSRRCETCEQVAEVRLMPVWERLKEILREPKIALERIAKYNAKKIEKDDTRDKIEQIQKALSAGTTKRQRLALLFSEGEIEHDDYRKNLMECRAEEERLRQEQLRLERQLLTKNEIKDIAEIIETRYKKWVAKLDSLNYEEQQGVLRMTLERIMVYPKKAESEVEIRLNPGNQVLSPFIGQAIGVNCVKLRDDYT